MVNYGQRKFYNIDTRTTRSWLGAIIAAEYVLHLVPTGTHDWNKFITPEELHKFLSNANLVMTQSH
jgi:2-polyprenyl-3-methyl-5-hydroxy-6-metoxy-1,4-benzoquinol methylase